MVANPVPSIMPKGAAEGRTLSGIRAPVIERYFEIFIFLYEIFISGLTYILICMKLSNMHISRRRTVYRCNDHIDVQVRKIYDTRGRCKCMHNIPTDVNRFSLQMNTYIYIYAYMCIYIHCMT